MVQATWGSRINKSGLGLATMVWGPEEKTELDLVIWRLQAVGDL